MKIKKSKLIEMIRESVNEAKIYSDDWNLTKRVTSNFIKQNLKSVDNSIKKKDGEGLRFHLNQIIKGIQNAKRALKLESVVTEANESKWTWIYKGMLSGFKKVGGGNDVNLEEVARATAFLVKTEYGAGAKNDFIKSLKKYIR
jgi:tRNA(Ile)-lysidine synthase TilS/MesJ